MNGQVIKREVGSDLHSAVRGLLDGLGGMASIIGPGERVMLKPNFNTADPFPASSSPDFIGTVADLIHGSGAGEVILAESCTFYLKTGDIFESWGIDRLVSGRPWLKVINLDEGRWVTKRIPGGQALSQVSVPELLDRIDRLVYLPCLKTHKWAQYTGALKLSVGLMSKKERLALHARRLQEKIGELNAVIRPDLVLMDARKCFITKGPSSGEVREPGLVLGSRSRFETDLEGVRVIQGYDGNSLAGIAAEELPQIRRAKDMGVDQQ